MINEKCCEKSLFCLFCFCLRRGILYFKVLEEGYNKVVIAYYLDDVVESFFMNFIYNGSLRSMFFIYRVENGLLVICFLIKV